MKMQNQSMEQKLAAIEQELEAMRQAKNNQRPNRLFNFTNRMLGALVAFVLVGSFAVAATLSFTPFQSGDIISSTTVNALFTSIIEQVNGNTTNIAELQDNGFFRTSGGTGQDIIMGGNADVEFAVIDDDNYNVLSTDTVKVFSVSTTGYYYIEFLITQTGGSGTSGSISLLKNGVQIAMGSAGMNLSGIYPATEGDQFKIHLSDSITGNIILGGNSDQHYFLGYRI